MRSSLLVPVVALLLAGCATQSLPPEPLGGISGTATHVPTPAAADPVALQLSATGVTALGRSGAVIGQVSFDAPVADVVDLVGDALGIPPVTSQFDEDACTDATGVTSYSWQNDAVVIVSEANAARLAAWRAPDSYRVGFRSTAVSGIDLRGPGGLRVGDDATTLVNALPVDHVDQASETALWVVAEVGGTYTNGQRSGYWGLGGIVDNGIVSSWLSPGYVFDTFC